MPRKSTKTAELKSLFALSGNICAFPGCTHPIINEKGKLIAEACHIEAANQKGERYNPNMTDDERASADNLILFCKRHHVETDDVQEYPVERLKRIKQEHEAHYQEKHYQIKDAVLAKILEEHHYFWQEIEKENHTFTKQQDLAMEITINKDFLKLFDELEDHLFWLYNIIDKMYGSFDLLPQNIEHFLEKLGYDTTVFSNVPYYKNPFHNMYWESYNLGVSNIKTKIKITTKILKIQYLLKLTSKTVFEEKELRKLQEELKLLATTAMYVD